MTTFRDQLPDYAHSLGEEGRGGFEEVLKTIIDQTMMFFLGLVLFSVIIAVIGVGNASAMLIHRL